MKKITTLLLAVFITTVSYAQLAGTRFKGLLTPPDEVHTATIYKDAKKVSKRIYKAGALYYKINSKATKATVVAPPTGGAYQEEMITIPNKIVVGQDSILVTNIGTGAFNSCYKLEKLLMPECLEYIEDNAIVWCTELKSITLPPNLSKTYWGPSNCMSIRDVYLLMKPKFGMVKGFPAHYSITYHVPKEYRNFYVMGEGQNILIEEIE